MLLEAGDGQDGPPPQGAPSVDAHQGQATGNSCVAAASGSPTGSIQGIAEASAAQPVLNPVPSVAFPAQPLSVSGAYVTVPPLATLPGVWSQLPDPSEFYALTRMPYPRMGYSPAPAGRMTPAPVTVTARTAITTTVTLSVAVSAVQTGLVYTSIAGPRALTPRAYAIRPGYGAVDHQYCIGSTFEDPGGLGMDGHPNEGYADVGAVGGVPEGAVGYLGPGGHLMQGRLGGGAGVVPRYEQATGGGYGALPREVRTSGYQSMPTDVVRADQAMVNGRVGWTSQSTTAGPCRPDEPVGPTAPSGRRAEADTATVASINVDTSRRTPSIWAGVEPVKLHAGVGYPYLDTGATGIPRSVYLGQTTQLRPAAPMQLANGQFY